MDFAVCWRLCAALFYPLFFGVGVLSDVLCKDENLGIDGGNYTFTKELKYGSMLIYHCPEGYYPYPALTRSCHKNGAWVPHPRRPFQKCKMIECPNPLVLENGLVLPVQRQYFVNNETTYECYSGYTLRGSSSRTCQTNGKWSGATPICSSGISEGDHCADPGTPAGARRTGDFFGISDKVTYRCDSGLYLVGSKERECQESGIWTGTEPKCYYKHTYDTEQEIAEVFSSTFLQSLQVAGPIDNPMPNKKLTIEKSGTMNIYFALDISNNIVEEQFNEVRRAVRKLTTKVSSFAVNPNYEIIIFGSEVSEIVNIIDYSGKNRKSLVDVLTDLENVKYDARENVGTNLNLAFKTILERMATQKQQNEILFKELYHVLIFFTDGAYNMGGNPENTVAKIREMVYMNRKERERHLDIYVFGVGNEIFDEGIQPLVTKRDAVTHYFKLRRGTKLEELFDQAIDEENAVGLCGIHRNYDDNTADSILQRYPWVARIEIKDEDTSTMHFCMGSLVTPRFILSAAQCFFYTNSEKKITVNIGKNEGATSPSYNSFSTKYLPICIPCTKETSAALKLVGGQITCKQQEERLLVKSFEEVSFLSFIKDAERRDVRRDARLKLQDQRDSCIGLATKINGITADNVKKLVTDNFLCSGGRHPTVDHVTCRGESGGAVFKNYDDYRTIQVGVISWGTKYLCPHDRRAVKQDSDDDSRDFHINLFKVVPFLKQHLGDDTQDFEPLHFLDE
ncbi:complement factor B [Esox lucius]|uniref:complement factor B n=1 Tax=Esox lucius TaxID=8010 RepID=UPI001476C45B|nr:complement factor B [Esox lucius]